MPRISFRKPDEPSPEGAVRVEFPERWTDSLEGAVELASRLMLGALRDGLDVDVITNSYAVAKVARLVGELLGGGPYEPFGGKVFKHLYNLEVAKGLGQDLNELVQDVRKDGLEDFAELLDEVLRHDR